MTNYDFDTLIDRQNTSSQKWEKYAGTDILPMWVADTDFPAAPFITQALRNRVDHGVFGYTLTPDSLNQVFIERMRRLYQWDVTAESLTWLPGMVNGLHLATRTVCQPGEAAISAEPIYPPFMSAPILSKRGLIKVPVKPNEAGHSIIDFDALRAAIDSHSKILLFCNPHNPGGAVYTRDELDTLATIIIENDLIICSDEIHCDLILEPGVKHIPIASLNPEIAERCITLMSPSKTWNIAGLDCSVAVITNPELRKQFQHTRKGIVPGVNLFGYVAAEAAYAQGDEWNAQQVEYLRGNRDLLIERINAIDGLRLEPFEATYLAWIEISDAGIDNPVAFFESAGVGMSPGIDFGSSNHMRLNFGCPRSRVEEAIKRIEAAMANR